MLLVILVFVKMNFIFKNFDFFVIFQPGLPLTLRNVHICNGLFDVELEVVDGDTLSAIVRKLRRINKNVKRMEDFFNKKKLFQFIFPPKFYHVCEIWCGKSMKVCIFLAFRKELQFFLLNEIEKKWNIWSFFL